MSAKKPKALTENEVRELIGLEPGVTASEVAEAVFKRLSEGEREDIKREVKKDIEDKITRLMYGGIIATVLVLLVIFVDYHFFKRDYNKVYLETQQQFSQEFRKMIEDNTKEKLERLREIDRLKERQDYLEKLMLERPTQIIQQPIQITTEPPKK